MFLLISNVMILAENKHQNTVLIGIMNAADSHSEHPPYHIWPYGIKCADNQEKYALSDKNLPENKGSKT